MASRWSLAVTLGFLLLVMASPLFAAEDIIRRVRILAPDHLRVEFSQPINDLSPENFRFTESRAPDVPIEVLSVTREPGNKALLEVAQRLDPAGGYHLLLRNPKATHDVAPTPWGLMISVIISAALINNFVFTRYLGLCVFFGVSKKRETAIGMGVTFWLVMIASGMISWAIFTFVMRPLQLGFLQVLVFIGIVAFLVQFVDIVLKKIQRPLHKKFGIYLMLITTNCIILAVPLLNASAQSGPLEALGLAVGSGGGFALALFLMSSARERLELAKVPESFQGLPIAFALAGLFALAFMGFSGLTILQ